MRHTIEQIIKHQRSYSASMSEAMRARGTLVRHTLPGKLEALGPSLKSAMGAYGADTEAQGRDNFGPNARIPWVRWFSRSRAPTARQGWYVVYLFHPDASGVSLCLSHGSTHLEGSNLIQRSDAEVSELMAWGRGVADTEFQGNAAIRRGVELGAFDLARAYERTTLFSKFYEKDAIPADAALRQDLISFLTVLALLYKAQDLGIAPGALSPDLIARRQNIESVTTPLRPRGKGQGRALSAVNRKLVELHAMQHAQRWLQHEGFTFEDVSATHSCDFVAKRNGEEWVVEVKGTTGGPKSVLLTANEVELHLSRYPRNALLVVHGISLSEDGVRVEGGELLAIAPWRVESERLAPVCYDYQLP